MSDEKEDGNSVPVNEVKDRKYGIGITRFFKVLGKDETRAKPSLNPIEHMKFVNKSPGKPRKRTFVSQAKRRKNLSGGGNLPLKSKASLDEIESKTETSITKEPQTCKEIKSKKVSSRKRRLKKGNCTPEDISKESSDPYSVDNSEDSDMIISYSAFLKDTLLKKKPLDQNEVKCHMNQQLNSSHSQSQRSITKYFSVSAQMQNGLSNSNSRKNKQKLDRTSCSRKRSKRLNHNSEEKDEEELVDDQPLKRIQKNSSQALNSVNNADNIQTNLRRSSRIRKTVVQQFSVDNVDDESTQSNDDVEKEKYACKISVIDDKDGKQSIKLRLTRISDKCKKSKAIVEKAHKIIRKSKKRDALKQTSKFEKDVECEDSNSLNKVTNPEKVTNDYPIAPLFLKSSKSLPKFDQETMERRMQFLRSGIPESLKQQQNAIVEEYCLDVHFPSIGHIAQLTEEDYRSSTLANFNICSEDYPNCDIVPTWVMGNATKCFKTSQLEEDNITFILSHSPMRISVEMLPKVLDEIQEKNSAVNVNDVYNFYASRKDPAYLNELHSIKKRYIASDEKSSPSSFKRKKTNRNGVEQIVAKIKQKSIHGKSDETECVQLSNCKGFSLGSQSDVWTNIYQPETSSCIIGNESSIMQLKSFLARFTAGEQNLSSNDNEGESSSDSSDAKPKAALVIGPIGCGKTLAIYTLAKELGYKVLEINASSKRSSKLIFSQLQEATQSHRVKEAPVLSVFSHQIDASHTKQDSSTISLILFEDVDVVFLEDEGFWSAVNEFISTTKRPVVLTTSDVKFEDKCCIKGRYETYKFDSPDIKSQVVHMQIMCLTDHWLWNEKDLYNLVYYNNSNLRQCILFLQYLCNSDTEYRNKTDNYGDVAMQKSITNVPIVHYGDSTFHKNVFLATLRHLYLGNYPKNYLLKNTCFINGSLTYLSANEECGAVEEASSNASYFKTLVRKLDNLCVLDCLSMSERVDTINFRGKLINGLDDKERLVEYDWFSLNLCSEIEIAVLTSATRLEANTKTQNSSSVVVTRQTLDDCLYQSVYSLHQDNKLTEACKSHQDTILYHMHLGHRLNSRAFCFEIIPSLRAICRSEKEKQINNNKRSSRFLHYLSSIGLYFETSTISELCKDLGPNHLACTTHES